MSTRKKATRAACVLTAAAALTLALFLGMPAPAEALGLRSITTVTGDYYVESKGYLIETDQVLLVNIIPGLTAEVKYTRDDTPGASTNLFTLGPVVSFTDTTYAIVTYGFGFDSAPTPNFIHEVNVGANWETDLSAILFNVKWDYFQKRDSTPDTWYILPSLGGRFHVLPQLGAFGEFFLAYSADPAAAVAVTGAFWGEADYAFSDLFTLRAGFTMSFSQSLGLSGILGADFNITPNVSLKYKFSYLYNAVQYFAASAPSTGAQTIENLLTLDWKI